MPSCFTLHFNAIKWCVRLWIVSSQISNETKNFCGFRMKKRLPDDMTMNKYVWSLGIERWTLNVELVATWFTCLVFFPLFFLSFGLFYGWLFCTVFTHSRLIRFSAFFFFSIFITGYTVHGSYIVSITICGWNCVNERRITYGFSGSDGTGLWCNCLTGPNSFFFISSSTGSSFARNYRC